MLRRGYLGVHTMMPVATLALRYTDPKGSASRILIAIATPYQRGARDWACPVAIDGLHAQLPDVHGASSLQALCLGISLVHSLLEERLSKGGTFLTDDSLPFDLNTCFGSFSMKSA
jgi:hypothetical protein